MRPTDGSPLGGAGRCEPPWVEGGPDRRPGSAGTSPRGCRGWRPWGRWPVAGTGCPGGQTGLTRAQARAPLPTTSSHSALPGCWTTSHPVSWPPMEQDRTTAQVSLAPRPPRRCVSCCSRRSGPPRRGSSACSSTPIPSRGLIDYPQEGYVGALSGPWRAVVIGRWAPVVLLVAPSWRKGSPRNCLVQRADGTRVVRPFRGLRKPAEGGTTPSL